MLVCCYYITLNKIKKFIQQLNRFHIASFKADHAGMNDVALFISKLNHKIKKIHNKQHNFFVYLSTADRITTRSMLSVVKLKENCC